MRTAVVTVLALIGGFIAGVVVSELFGIVGLLLLDSLVGFRFLPLASAMVAAGAAVVVSLRARRRSAWPAPSRQRAADHQAVRHDPGS
jgi:hypothetical protein